MIVGVSYTQIIGGIKISEHGLKVPQLKHPVCIIYCPNCGVISGYSLPDYVDTPGWENKWKKDKRSKCKYCGHTMWFVPNDENDLIEKFKSGSTYSKYKGQEYQDEAIAYIKEHYITGSELAEQDRLRQKEEEHQHWEEYKKSHPGRPVIKCPVCQSTNVSKISLTKKIVKTSLFGILGAASDAGKTYKCNSCGCKF